MSVRRRAIAARVEHDRRFRESWDRSTRELESFMAEIATMIADRDGHRRMDDDGAAPRE